MEFSELKSLLEKQGDAINAFKADQAARLDEIEKRMNRPGAFNGDNAPRAKTLVSTTGRKLVIAGKGESLAALNRGDDTDFDLGQYARNAIIGTKTAMGSGAALVPTRLSDSIIDTVRNQSAIFEAGAQFVEIGGPENMARITSDPDVIQHTENTDDITESIVGTEAVSVNPKLLAALIPLSEELVQDSPNLSQVLQTAISGAFAAKLDALCIATLLADTNIPKSAAAQDPASWIKVVEAVGSAMAAKQPLPRALICSAGDFAARAGQLASTAGSWLGKPPSLAAMTEHPTAGMSNGTAIMGDFARAMIVAGRADLRIEIIRWKHETQGQHVLVAHARMDGVVIQPKLLYKLLKTIA